MKDKFSFEDAQAKPPQTLVFYVNGIKITETAFDPASTLLEYLRQKLGLTGTKYGCGEGGCGACTVMVSKFCRRTRKICHLSVNACLTPLPWVHGHSVTTVEGIGSTRTRMHAVQDRLARSHGSQCGFCTPGFVMSMYTLLRNNPLPTMDHIEEYFQGNLCRCTGYRAILEGYQTFTNKALLDGNAGGCNGCPGSVNGGCCQQQRRPREPDAGTAAAGSRHVLNGGGTSSEAVSAVAGSKFVNGNKKEAESPGRTCKGGALTNGLSDDVGVGKPDVCDDMATKLILPDKFAPYDPSQEPIFPPELQIKAEQLQTESLVFKGPTLTWYRPVTLQELLTLKKRFPDAKIIGGNTEVALEMRQKGCEYSVLISSEGVPELHETQVFADVGNNSSKNRNEQSDNSSSRFVRIGAAATLTQTEQFLRGVVSNYPEQETGTFRAVLEMLEWFAGKQVRNVAALGGNIATSSPISDLNPLLMAGRAEVVVSSTDGAGEQHERRLRLDDGFFLGYRRNALLSGEVLVSVDVPFAADLEYVAGYKQARRRDDDIAVVNAGFRVRFARRRRPDGGGEDGRPAVAVAVVDDVCLAFGGMAEKTIRVPSTEVALLGREWDETLLELARQKLSEDLPLPFGAPGGKEEYRRTLALSFFYKFWTTVGEELRRALTAENQGGAEQETKTADSSGDLSAIERYARGDFGASQIYQIVPDGQPGRDPVGRPMVFTSALEQCTGEAKFLDDLPPYAHALHMYPVLSTRARARVVGIDTGDAERVAGYVGLVSADDVPSNENSWGIFGDDKIFYTDEVSAQGQIICAVVAKTREAARVAARNVKIDYQDLGDPILTIQEAVEKKALFSEVEVKNGDVEEILKTAAHVVEGEVRIGGQEHFYLELQGCLAVPRTEHGEMEIFATTQDHCSMQLWVSKALGVPANRILVRVKRLGGGFGGKESRNGVVTLPTTVAAAKFGVPVSCNLERTDDFRITGQRHGFYSKYRLAADSDGKLLALDLELYNNAGYSRDLSPFVLEKAMLECTNAYEIPVCRVRGYCCQTNLTSNTAFRGFGAVQSMMICEQFVSHMADELKLPQKEFREMNLKQEGCKQYYGQVLTDVTLQRCWNEVLEASHFSERFQAVQRYNREHKWRKRGLAITPETYGISFTAACMNQAGALVHIYKDGSVLVTHGGVEMGQGLHTKMIQVASRALRIPPSYIHTSEVATDKVPNTQSTAASFSADLNGPAVMRACEKLLQRLEPYMVKNPKGKWEDWVSDANLDCVSLSATGFYKAPTIHSLFESRDDVPHGYINIYHSYGAAVSEVEVDCLTGDHKVLRTDIVFDVGDSLNPAVDVGQIEGGFVQGYGLWVLEDLEFGPEGQMRTVGPSTYKIPSSRDTPEVFNVALLKGAPNPHAIYSSKAVGEPPLFLSASIFFAIRDAIEAYRKQNGISGHFQLDTPATSERIRMLCQDKFTSQVQATQPTKSKNARPWTIQV